MIPESLVSLSRLQFAATAMYHFLFVPLTLGMVWLLVIMETVFPFVMPSSSMPNASLTVWDSVSSHLTLGLMFWATLIFMPLIVFYTAWACRVMRGKVTVEHIRANEHTAY